MSLTSRLLFLQKLFRQPTTNASITPSSRYLARAMIKGIDFSHVRTIVEFGPGTGVFTKAIIKKAHPECSILCIEYEEAYVELLNRDFGKRIIIEHGSVLDIEQILHKHNIARPDLIISWLPFSVYTVELMKTLETYINKWTIFRWFSYTPHQFRDIYKELPLEQKAFVLRNIPPAFVFGAN